MFKFGTTFVYVLAHLGLLLSFVSLKKFVKSVNFWPYYSQKSWYHRALRVLGTVIIIIFICSYINILARYDPFPLKSWLKLTHPSWRQRVLTHFAL